MSAVLREQGIVTIHDLVSVWSRSGGRRPFIVRSRSILVLSKPLGLILNDSAISSGGRWVPLVTRWN